MSLRATEWVLLLIFGVLSLVIAVFHRALLGASPARLEEINEELQWFKELPDVEEALVATGWLKAAVYAAFGGAVAFARFSEAGFTLGSYFSTLGTAAALLVSFEALALVLAGYHTGKALYSTIPFIKLFAAAGAAVLSAGAVAAGIMARIVGREEPLGPEEAAAEDILDAVSEGTREGVLDEEEREMIESIIEFKDVEVSAIMTTRTELVTANAAESVSAALETAIASGHSRLPVCTGTADDVLGLFYVKDVLQMVGSDRALTTSIKDVMRAPYFVPETKRVRELLKEFRATNVHMAIVLDEYGGTSGIVTIEDVLEEIVGEIEDEYDAHQPPEIRPAEPGKATVAGQADFGEVVEALNAGLADSEEYETIAGYVLYHIGRIPKSGEILEINGLRLTVQEADERRIKTLFVEVIGNGGRAGTKERKAGGGS